MHGERARIAVAGLCAAAVLTALALPTLRGELYLDSDLGKFYVPVRAFYQQALRAGTEYLWYPYEFAGFYLHGEGQAGLAHPLNQLSYRWLPLTLAFGLEIVRGYAFALVGAFLFFRRYALPASAAGLGAFTFAFASFHVLHVMHPNVVAASAHLPWLLLALDAMARGATPLRRALAAPLYALLTASQLLLGHPQVVWLCAVVEALYALLLWRGGAPARTLVHAAAAKALGTGAAAIQLLPTWDALRHSLRSAWDAEFAASFSLHPLDAVQLVQPYLLGERVVEVDTIELGLYAGGFGVIALAWLALRARAPGDAGRLGRGALVLALLGAWLALGPHGGLQPLLAKLPVLGLFRAPCRHLLWIHVAVSVAVALGFADLLTAPRRRGRAWWAVLALLPLLSCAAALSVSAFAPQLALPLWPFAVPGVVALTATALLAAGAAKGSAAARIALLAFACADLGAYGLSFVSSRVPPPASLESIRASIQLPREAREYRLADGEMIATLDGVRFLWGYVALWPRKELPIFPRDARAAHLDARDWATWQASLRVSSVLDRSWRPLPRARLVAQAQPSDDLARDLTRVDLATTALVAEPVALDEAPPGEASITSETPGELRIATRAPGRQLLIVSESFHEGWRAWIDGAPAELLRVYGDYMGCVVPAGEHEVRLHFEPRSHAVGARVSAAALAAIAAWGAAVCLRSRRGNLVALEVGDEAARRQEQV